MKSHGNRCTLQIYLKPLNFILKLRCPFQWWQPPHKNMPLAKDLLHPCPEEAKRKHKNHLGQNPILLHGCEMPRMPQNTPVFTHAQMQFCVLNAPLSSASPQEEKQGWQKDVPSEGSSIKSTLKQDEWKTIPIPIFWIYSVCLVKLLGSSCPKYSGGTRRVEN
jgi:hypothetical protein